MTEELNANEILDETNKKLRQALESLDESKPENHELITMLAKEIRDNLKLQTRYDGRIR